MRAAELCSGYNGLGMAVEHVFGAEPAWFAEYEDAPSRILAHHYPNIPNHGDMTKIDWAAVEPVDIISGGTPCQDLSAAGKRAGMTEGTRSNLWVQMREAIATIKPTYVVWENVRGAYSASAYSEMEQQEGRMGETGNPNLRALGRVLGDLSDLGYDCQWRGLRAADVGAPHGRFRVFVLATHRDHIRKHRPGQWSEQDGRGQSADSGCATTDANRGNDNGWVNDQEWEALKRTTPTGGGEATGRITPTYADHKGPQGQHDQAGTTSTQRYRHTSEGVDWREYSGAIRRWEALHGAAPSPVEMSPTGKPRLSPDFTEWMMGVPAGWITEVPGIGWGDALKACGNGVVPGQAIAALQDMLHANELRRAA